MAATEPIMDEARRFLRYVTPGIAFLVQVGLYWFLLDRPGAIAGAEELLNGGALGAGVTIFLASVGIGFLLSTIHHALYWHVPSQWLGPIDYREMLAAAAEGEPPILRFRAANRDPFLWSPEDVRRNLSVEGAWRLVTRLWHQRGESIELIRSCLARNKSLFDIMHATGAARIGALTAPFLAGCLKRPSSGPVSGHMLSAVFVLALLLSLSHFAAYVKTRQHAQSFLESALLEGLYANRQNEREVWCTINSLDLRPTTGIWQKACQCALRFARAIIEQVWRGTLPRRKEGPKGGPGGII